MSETQFASAATPSSGHDHSPHFDIASLYLVNSEITESLRQIEAALSQYISDPTATVGLSDAVELMQQVHGVLKLLQMNGAIELADAIQLTVRHVTDHPDTPDNEQLTSLSEGLMSLARYLEFVLLHETLSPSLLLPVINTLRTDLGLPKLSEGHWLAAHIDPALAQHPVAQQALQSSGQSLSPALTQYLKQMFQTGLHAVIQNKAQPQHYQLMARASSYMHSGSKTPLTALYWEIANHVVQSLPETHALSDSRLRVLSKIERHLGQQDAQSITHTDIADILAMTAIRPEATVSTLSALHLTHHLTPDYETLNHKKALFGPDQEVIHTVSQLIHEGIINAKSQIDIITSGNLNIETIAALSNHLLELGQTLEMLNLSYAGQGLTHLATSVGQWQQLPTEEQMNTVMDRLLDCENAIILMEQSHTPGLVMLPFTNLRISLHQLVEARQLMVNESRQCLTTAREAILGYLEQQASTGTATSLPASMNDVADHCDTVSGAMVFLNSPRGQAIMKQTAQYLRDTVAAERPMNEDATLCLSDAMACVDYVLEGFQTKKPTGEHPYSVGEHSLAKLGYPVSKAA